jgi:DNA-binding transcriptional MocR family regulator
VEAGLQTTGWLRTGLDVESVAARAAKREVGVTPLHRYSHGRIASEGLLLGLAVVDVKEIRRGVRDLALALEDALKTLNRSDSQAPLR